MTKEDKVKSILNRLYSRQEISDKHQEAMDNLTETFASNSYNLILEDTPLSAYIDGVGLFNQELKEWLEYIAYEVDEEKDWEVKSGGNKYNFRHKEDRIKFLVNEVEL